MISSLRTTMGAATFVLVAAASLPTIVHAYVGSWVLSERRIHLKAIGFGRNEAEKRPHIALGTATLLDIPAVSMGIDSRGHRLESSKGDAVMDTTTLGTLTVPSVGIGTISWSSDSPLRLESEKLQKLVDVACRSNGAFFDTAERYGSHLKAALGMGWGETESLTAKMLQQVHSPDCGVSHEDKKDPLEQLKPVVATKFTPTPWRYTADSVVEACEESRKRLGVDQIDLYQLHMPDIVQPLKFLGRSQVKDELYWDGLAACYHHGLVKNVGVSNYGPTLLMKCQEALAKRGVPLASNQIAFSLIGRHNGAQETVDMCNEVGIKVLGFFPFAMGLLTGKYSPDSNHRNVLLQSPKAVQVSMTSLIRSKKSELEKLDLKRYAKGDGERIPAGGIGPLMDVMKSIARERGKTVAQVALNYIVCQGIVPIPGANTYSQVVDNMGAMGWRLTEVEVEMLESAADSLGFGFEGAGFKRTSEKFVGYGVEKWSLD